MMNNSEYVLAELKAEMVNRFKNKKDRYLYAEDVLAIIAEAEVEAILGEQEYEETKEAE